MKKLRDIAFALLFCIGLMFILGLAGRQDYVDRHISEIPSDVYFQIKQKLGADASQYQIVDYYEQNKQAIAANR